MLFSILFCFLFRFLFAFLIDIPSAIWFAIWFAFLFANLLPIATGVLSVRISMIIYQRDLHRILVRIVFESIGLIGTNAKKLGGLQELNMMPLTLLPTFKHHWESQYRSLQGILPHHSKKTIMNTHTQKIEFQEQYPVGTRIDFIQIQLYINCHALEKTVKVLGWLE